MGTVCWTFGLSAQCVEQKIAATTILCLYTCQTHEVSHKMSAPWGGCDGNLSDSMLISIIMMSMTATVMMMVLMMMMRTMMMMTIIVMMLQRTYFAMRIPGHKIRIL